MMKKWILSMGLGFLLATPALQAASHAPSMKQKINDNFRSVAPGPHWALWVKDLSTGKQIYTRRSYDFFVPASSLKLVTAAAAVDALGTQFQFKTRLGWHGRVVDGRLKGDLYLHMSGDPTLTSSDLEELFNDLKHHGIHSVSGKLYVDTSRFHMEPYGPGWMRDDLSYAYMAPMSSIVLNENRFVLTVIPQQLGQSPEVKLNVGPGIVHVENDALVTKSYDKWCPLTVYSNNMNYYHIGGCLVKHAGPQVRVLAMRDPWPYFKSELQAILDDEHIVIEQGMHVKKKRPRVKWQLTHSSEPLPDLIHEMLKESNNLIADALFVEIGRKRSRKGGNWQGGALAVRQFLKHKVGINVDKLELVDGAGGSRYNLIRPIQMAQLLLYIRKHESMYQVIFPALPISGKDGTLIWRTRHSLALGRVHAKTGSMTGVSSLAGYVNRADGHQLAFVIMMNGWAGKLKTWRPVENRLLEILATGSIQ